VKFLIDLFPIIAFFGAYQWSDMFVATAVVMVACAVQTFGYRLVSGEFDRNHLLALILVLPFGALTLLLRDPMFIKWNGTVELWFLAVALLVSQYVGEKPLIERMMGEGLVLPPKIWRQVNLAWVLFFLFSGACNIYVAYNFEEATWMNFKMFGMTGMSIAFVALQMVWIMRVMPPQEEAESEDLADAESSDADAAS
jgi:intracellular septation protein